MDATHVHLMVNHIPILFTPAALLILIWGWIRDIQPLQSLSLWGFVISGVAAYIAFESGEGAEETVETLLKSGEHFIHDHEEWAEWSFWSSILLGLASIGGIYVNRTKKSVKQGVFGIIVLLGLISSGMLIYTAYLGGQIRHSEIRPDQSQVIENNKAEFSAAGLASNVRRKPEEQRLLPMMQKLMVQMNRINTGILNTSAVCITMDRSRAA